MRRILLYVLWVFAVLAYHFFGWAGLAIFAFCALTALAFDALEARAAILTLLDSRLAERCAVCHREILDVGGVADADGIYHEACSERLEQHSR